MKRPLTWSDLHTPTHTDRYTEEPTFSSPWQVKLTHTPNPLVILQFCTRTYWYNMFTCTTKHPSQNLSIWSCTSPILDLKIGGVIMKNTTVCHCLMRALDETKGWFLFVGLSTLLIPRWEITGCICNTDYRCNYQFIFRHVYSSMSLFKRQSLQLSFSMSLLSHKPRAVTKIQAFFFNMISDIYIFI